MSNSFTHKKITCPRLDIPLQIQPPQKRQRTALQDKTEIVAVKSIEKKLTLKNLSSETLANIIGFLCFSESSIPQAAIFKVDREFKKLFQNRIFKRLLPIDLCIKNILKVEYLSFLKGRFLRKLTLYEFPGQDNFKNKDLVVLNGMPLEVLELPQSQEITDEGIKNFEGMSLEHLKLARTGVTGKAFQYLKNMPLRCLDVCSCAIEAPDLALLKDLPIEELNFSECGDPGIHIEQLNKRTLTRLIFCNQHIGDECIRSLASFNLKHLTLQAIGLSNERLGLLRGIGLESLSLSGNYEEIDDDGLAHLVGFTSLKKLHLRSLNKITDNGLARLVTLPLEHLDLHGLDEITEYGIGLLKDIITLRELDLSNSHISDKCIDHLREMNLKKLNISETGITAMGIRLLMGSSLEEVYIGVEAKMYKNHFSDMTFEVLDFPKGDWETINFA